MAETGQNSMHATLTAATNTTFTLSNTITRVRVICHVDSASPIYVRGDGTAAVVKADETWVVLPGAHRIISVGLTAAGARQVDVISAGTPTVTVETSW